MFQKYRHVRRYLLSKQGSNNRYVRHWKNRLRCACSREDVFLCNHPPASSPVAHIPVRVCCPWRMPSANPKQATEAEDPIRQAIKVIEHKIRNLEKRKVRNILSSFYSENSVHLRTFFCSISTTVNRRIDGGQPCFFFPIVGVRHVLLS